MARRKVPTVQDPHSARQTVFWVLQGGLIGVVLGYLFGHGILPTTLTYSLVVGLLLGLVLALTRMAIRKLRE